MLISDGEHGIPVITGVTKEESRLLRGMPYIEFLNSGYWRAVSRIIRARAGFRCQKCGRRNDLESHHKTMKHHGFEHKHLNDLICLCHNCHRLLHVETLVCRPRVYKRRKQHRGPNTHSKRAEPIAKKILDAKHYK